MKVIADETITAVSASSENPAYPATNVLNRHPKKAWKAEGVTNLAMLNVTYSGGLSDLGFIGTNAESVKATAPAVEGFSWESGDAPMQWETNGQAVNWEGATIIITNVYLVSTDTGEAWLEFFELSGDGELALLLEAPVGETLRVGVISGGHAIETSDPDYKAGEKLLDYSISKETSNGGFYYRKRNIVRQYNLTFEMDRNTEALSMMRRIGMQIGQWPLMWRLTSLDHSQWIVYGRAEVSQSHDYWDKNTVNIRITEAV